MHGSMLRALIMASALAVGSGPVQAQTSVAREQVLRVVMNNELQSLDPIVTASFVTRTFGFMIWDTLLAVDSKGEIRPQMLESWQVSDDGLRYTFKLRPGLEWHDGTPVLAEDCVISLRRWGAKDGLGRQLMAAAADLAATGPDTFVLTLARPFSQVLEALSKPGSFVPFMMPARLAQVPATQPLTEFIGSGPFLFRPEEWRPGNRLVVRRNPRYRPRDEPADGLAGGKVVQVDRVDIISIGDAATRVAALQGGEADILERVPPDFIRPLQRNRNIVVKPNTGSGLIMGLLQVNHAQPPFDNPRIRHAMVQAIDQSEVMAGLGLPEDMSLRQCLTIYLCGTRYATEAGAEHMRAPSLDRARQMLREAGYRNEPVVVLNPVDSPLINAITLVAADRLRQAGFNVDIRSTDWGSVVQLWTNRKPVSEGGWSLTGIIVTGFELENPLSNWTLTYNCVNFPGWYCDEPLRDLARQFAEERNQDRRKTLAAQMQVRAHEAVTTVLLGQFAGAYAHRADLQGVLDPGFPVLWNIRRATP